MPEYDLIFSLLSFCILLRLIVTSYQTNCLYGFENKLGIYESGKYTFDGARKLFTLIFDS